MLGSEDYLKRAAELEERAAHARDPIAREELMKAAEGWRDLARRVAEAVRRQSGD